LKTHCAGHLRRVSARLAVGRCHAHGQQAAPLRFSKHATAYSAAGGPAWRVLKQPFQLGAVSKAAIASAAKQSIFSVQN
jgi:hypothetical protein